MSSSVISATKDQLTLNFEPGLAERYGSLRECIATGVYQRGLKRVAIDLDQAPSNLSVQLSEDSSRNFSVDSLEKYIEKTGDTAPIHYLIERFLASGARNDGSKKVAAMRAKMAEMMRELEGMGAA
jgi:acetolactate synthase regulatory subunit